MDRLLNIIFALTVCYNSSYGQTNQILYEGCLCIDSAYVDQSLNWYALIKSDKRFFYSLKPVELTLSTSTTCELATLEIKTNIDSGSEYLIGSKEVWKEREIYAPHNWDQKTKVDITKSDMNIYSIDLKDSNLSSSNELLRYGHGDSIALAITGKTASGKEITQHLQTNFETTTIKKHGLYLNWFGDIDGDNRADLILWTQTDGEGGTYYYLFLSSIAKSDQVIGEASETILGHCN